MSPYAGELTIVAIDTPTLGNRSYLAHDGSVALVVDPQRDLDRVLGVAEQHGVRITHVAETHIHNDYVTGGLALAEATGAAYLVNGDDPVTFARTPVHDGETVAIGATLRVRAIATPGHTYSHLSYALERRRADGTHEAVAVFTGGSLLPGTTGRPDLLGPDHRDALVHHQFASAHRLARELPDTALVLPTHGFGSFCSPGAPATGASVIGATGASGASAVAVGPTIGTERRGNPVLTQREDRWIAATLTALDAFPAYYAHMAPANLAGPAAPDLSTPEPADRDTLARRIRAGEWVVDLRHRSAFAAGHVPGSLSFGIDGSFATYLGWLIPWGTPLTLLGESPEQVAEAQRELVRIGIDRLAGAATGSPREWTSEPLASYATATFADLAEVRHHRPVVVLDVRRVHEFAERHVDGALNIPLHELAGRLGELPPGEVWVHCASGYRASIGASILAAHGVRVVAVDDDFGLRAAASGLSLARAA